MITRCDFERVVFQRSDLSKAIFNHSVFRYSKIDSSLLEGASFFDVTVQNSELAYCDLTDVLLFLRQGIFKTVRCSKNVLTKPVIAMPIVLQDKLIFAPLIRQSLEENGALCLMIEASPSNEVNGELLEQEIIGALSSGCLGKQKGPEFLSLADRVLSEALPGSQVYHVTKLANQVMAYADGLLLPGGDSMAREWYGQSSEPLFDHENWEKACMEFALLKSALDSKKPKMGFCLGSQRINVFLGGTLKDVEGQWGFFQDLQRGSSLGAKKFQQEEMKLEPNEPFISFSCHEQAVDQMSPLLNLIFDFDGIPKLMVSQERGFVMASQVHPEIYRYIDEVMGNLGKYKEIEMEVVSSEGQITYIQNPEIVANVSRINNRIYGIFMEKVKDNQLSFRT